jgi:hypothetical protein
MSDSKAANDFAAAASLQGKGPSVEEIGQGRYCQTCGRWMWAAEMDGIGLVWHCASCHYTINPNDEKVPWNLPRRDHLKKPGKERKVRGLVPCPRCNQPMWVVEIPDYGSRKQCEECRISVIPGGFVLEWRSHTPQRSE